MIQVTIFGSEQCVITVISGYCSKYAKHAPSLQCALAPTCVGLGDSHNAFHLCQWQQQGQQQRVPSTYYKRSQVRPCILRNEKQPHFSTPRLNQRSLTLEAHRLVIIAALRCLLSNECLQILSIISRNYTFKRQHAGHDQWECENSFYESLSVLVAWVHLGAANYCHSCRKI